MSDATIEKGIHSRGVDIGPGYPVFIIAEAGVNHNGDLAMAFDLVDAAAEAGADAVKFQTFVTENVITREAPKANYHIETTGGDSIQSWFDLIKSEELSAEEFFAIKRRCDEKDIVFLSTPYDEQSVDVLSYLDVPLIKIASTDTDNVALLEHVGKTEIPVILSTGMSTLSELRNSVETLRGADCRELVVMQCTAEYPAPAEDANLHAMHTIAEACGVAVGYSDHVNGATAAIVAVALGACAYEKHFTLDRSLPGPDHRASMEPGELKDLIEQIRIAEAALGDGVKRVMPCEEKNREILRRKLVAARDLPAHKVLERADIAAKRTGGRGIAASQLHNVLGRELVVAVEADRPLTAEVLK